MRRSSPRPAVKLFAAGLTLVVGSVALGFVAGSAVRSPAQVVADTAPPRPTVLTEAVTVGTATRAVTFDGRVEQKYNFAVPAPAVGEGSASAVVTRLPHREGDAVKSGALIAEVSGRPVMVLEGRIPSFRNLVPGSEGRDVAQLQEGLRRAGLSVDDAPGKYGPGTGRAVASLYERHGYDASVIGADEVEAAELAVRDQERSLEQTRGTGDRSAVRYAEEDLQRARSDLADARAASGPQVPAGEIVFLPALPATVTEIDSAIGAPVGDSILQLAAGPLVVRGEPLAADLHGLRRGAPVELLLSPEGRVTGRVAQVAATAPASEDSSGAAAGGRTVTVVPTKPLPRRRTGAAVRVVVTVAQSPSQGLVVPISAVVAVADGRTFVTVVSDGKRREVEVTTGFLGNGVVQVAPTGGSALSAGERVAIGLGG